MTLKQVFIPKPVLTIGISNVGGLNLFRVRCGKEELGQKSPDGILQFLKGFRSNCPYPVDVRFDFPSENGPDFAEGVDAANRLFPRIEIKQAPV